MSDFLDEVRRNLKGKKNPYDPSTRKKRPSSVKQKVNGFGDLKKAEYEQEKQQEEEKYSKVFPTLRMLRGTPTTEDIQLAAETGTLPDLITVKRSPELEFVKQKIIGDIKSQEPKTLGELRYGEDMRSQAIDEQYQKERETAEQQLRVRNTLAKLINREQGEVQPDNQIVLPEENGVLPLSSYNKLLNRITGNKGQVDPYGDFGQYKDVPFRTVPFFQFHLTEHLLYTYAESLYAHT